MIQRFTSRRGRRRPRLHPSPCSSGMQAMHRGSYLRPQHNSPLMRHLTRWPYSVDGLIICLFPAHCNHNSHHLSQLARGRFLAGCTIPAYTKALRCVSSRRAFGVQKVWSITAHRSAQPACGRSRCCHTRRGTCLHPDHGRRGSPWHRCGRRWCDPHRTCG